MSRRVARVLCWVGRHDWCMVIDKLNPRWRQYMNGFSFFEAQIVEKHYRCTRCGKTTARVRVKRPRLGWRFRARRALGMPTATIYWSNEVDR